MFKTDMKTRNYSVPLLCDKMSNESQENWICENEFIIQLLRRQIETKYNRISILELIS